MRRHPGAIRREQRAMRRARTALRGLGTVRRTLDAVATTGGKVSIERQEIVPDEPTCAHGVAMDVHCCNCHSGFLFDIDSCVCCFEFKRDRG